MPDVGFGGNVGNAFSGFAWVRSDGIGLPSGRAMANGSTAVLIVAVGAYAGGRGATRLISLQLGSAATAGFNVPSDDHPVAFTGYVGTNSWLVNGGSTSFYLYTNAASVNFGRSSTSGAAQTVNNVGTTWSGIMGGALRYVQAPAAPVPPSLVSSLAGEMDVSWSAPGDDGGSGVTGYVVQYARNSAFTSGLVTQDAAGTSAHLTGLTPGQRYYVRVAAKNAVTISAGTWGPWSAASSLIVLSGARYGQDDEWVDCQTFAGINGAWVPVSIQAGRPGAWTVLE